MDHLPGRAVAERDPIGLQFVSTAKEDDAVAATLPRIGRTMTGMGGFSTRFIETPRTRHRDAKTAG